MKHVIKVANLSKRYRLGLKEKQSETFVGQVSNIIKSPFQNLKRLRNLSHFNFQDDSVFWALKDISFEVKEGEVLGIIGKNGSGKSTLLKILSGITDPTEGRIEIFGRVASLLEVGTGFHPELSGRDNIYMNGTILGMTRKEIDSKLDEIIDFSGVEKFIDTPVKFYSSGMKVRLGFSVAAHLDPEILIIDEVLAVGDYEFQKKCLGKMEDVSMNQGRTVLFVSHSMTAVKSLCKRAIVLEDGEKVFEANQDKAVCYYLNNNSENNEKDLDKRTDRTGNGKMKLINVTFHDENDNIVKSVLSGEFLRIRFFYKVFVEPNSSLVFAISFKDSNEIVKSMVVTDEMDVDVNAIIEKGYVTIDFEKFLLRGGIYNLTVLISERGTSQSDHIDRIDKVLDVEVLQGDFYNVGRVNRSIPSGIIPCLIY